MIRKIIRFLNYTLLRDLKILKKFLEAYKWIPFRFVCFFLIEIDLDLKLEFCDADHICFSQMMPCILTYLII
ncbi:hypothetical protein BpHYR1_007538 [Brachionus plicatilis]|uniref:Uncharacterized protein n=1 Tax=Brachionus plicatilis TaxID=10195 RepID=A0A3M7S257_BRAPC|nr:hypothetical protein BpHYR1_007538 [Brachionus plicatilis]